MSTRPLHLDSSILREHSVSRRPSAEGVARMFAADPQIEVIGPDQCKAALAQAQRRMAEIAEA